MGRPPSHGGPSFRFNPSEVNEMEAILQAHKTAMPAREVLVALAEKFSSSAERSGKFVVQMKQVWNWFQNRRYAIRAKTAKSPGKFSSPPVAQREPAAVTPAKLSASPVPQSDPSAVRIMPQAPQPIPTPQAPQSLPAASVPSVGRTASENSQLEFEAKSARDGAWYDVASFLSYKSVEAGDPEVQVRFAGFGEEEDEWVNVRKHVRQRSLPCESSECVAVLPNDLILCFQEGKEQALYFDAHVLDAQRRRHDVRGCRCRFLVRYDHDQSEEIVPLRKVCRRPETDYRLQQLNAEPPLKQQKIGNGPTTGSTMKVDPPAETTQKAQTESRIKPEEPTQKQPAPEDTLKPGPNVVPMQLQKSGTESQTGNTLEPTQKQPAPEDIIKPGPNAAPMQLQKSSTESLTGNTLEPTQKQPTPEDTIKPGPNAAPMQLHESSTDSLTDNTLETPKSMEEMPKKPVPEMPEKPVADTAEVPQAEKEELHAESTDKAPAEVTENPSAKTPVEPPAELAENPSAEATVEPPAEVADNPTAEITLEALADSTSKLAEAPAEQSKAEEHVDAEAVVVSADNVNASL